MNECRTQKKVLSRIAAYREFWRQKEPRALRVSGMCGIDDLADVAVQITHNKVQLRNAQLESHG